MNKYNDEALARTHGTDCCDVCHKKLSDDELARNCSENDDQDGNSMLCDRHAE